MWPKTRRVYIRAWAVKAQNITSLVETYAICNNEPMISREAIQVIRELELRQSTVVTSFAYQELAQSSVNVSGTADSRTNNAVKE